MKSIFTFLSLAAISVATLNACSPSQQAAVQPALQSQAGQLFCAINKSGVAQPFVAQISQTAVSASGSASPVAGAVAVLVQGMLQADVDNACNAAAAAVGAASAIPVSPPSVGTPVVNVTIPAK
jgi:hypothetical protein